MNIPTRLSNKPAPKMLVPSKFQDLLMLKPAMILLMPSLEDPFQLLLMLPTGQPTKVEFSLTAKLPLTTESPLPESLINTGTLKTLGEPLGERVDTSD